MEPEVQEAQGVRVRIDAETLPMSGPGAGIPVRVDLALPKIPGYQVSSHLGGGGMGDVYRAVQLGTRRPVALKLMRRDFVSDKARRRFDREIELTARLDHPNIARIYDSGVHDSIWFYAMELIEGEPLDEFHASHGLASRQTLELMRIIAQAIQHAHQRGVIHRDLKPANVLVTPDGQPHVLDFGLAKALVEDGGALISGVREVVGTPAYMSPEQAAGETNRVDTRTDVYSLGVMLYKLLTGQHPHDLEGKEQDVIRRISHEEVRRPREMSREVDWELEALLLKALARSPEDRYASAGELARDVDNYLGGDPLIARRATLVYVLKKRLRKHARAVGLAMVGVMLAAAFAVATFPMLTAAIMLLALAGIASFAYLRIRHVHGQVLVQRNRTESLLRLNEAMNRRQKLAALWNLILSEARALTDADAGTLFVRRENALEFAVAQNQTLAARMGEKAASELFKHFRLPISADSVAGYVALTGKLANVPDALHISPRLPFKVNASMDKQHDYQTRSMLVVPVRDPDGAVMGVLQLLNRKSASGEFARFTTEHESLMNAFASLAAVAMRNQELRAEPAAAEPGIVASGAD